MIVIADALRQLECLMLEYGYNQAMYENLDISCPELEEDKIVFKESVKLHMLLTRSEQFGCSLNSEILCNIESFLRLHPCVCTSCSSTCADFTISETATILCGGFDITENIEDY